MRNPRSKYARTGPATGPFVFVRARGDDRIGWHVAGPNPDGERGWRSLCGLNVWGSNAESRQDAPPALDRCCATCLRLRHLPLDLQRAMKLGRSR